MQDVLIFILLLVSVAIIALVLLQHGKGADAGAAFGSGASSTVFGSQGPASFLMKLTGFLVLAFFVICIALTRIATNEAKPAVPVQQPAQQQQTANQNAVPSAPNAAEQQQPSSSTVPSAPKN